MCLNTAHVMPALLSFKLNLPADGRWQTHPTWLKETHPMPSVMKVCRQWCSSMRLKVSTKVLHICTPKACIMLNERHADCECF